MRSKAILCERRRATIHFLQCHAVDHFHIRDSPASPEDGRQNFQDRSDCDNDAFGIQRLVRQHRVASEANPAVWIVLTEDKAMRRHQLDKAIAACQRHRDPGRVMKAGNVDKQFRYCLSISSTRRNAF